MILFCVKYDLPVLVLVISPVLSRWEQYLQLSLGQGCIGLALSVGKGLGGAWGRVALTSISLRFLLRRWPKIMSWLNTPWVVWVLPKTFQFCFTISFRGFCPMMCVLTRKSFSLGLLDGALGAGCSKACLSLRLTSIIACSMIL